MQAWEQAWDGGMLDPETIQQVLLCTVPLRLLQA